MNAQYKNYTFKIQEIVDEKSLDALQSIKVYARKVDGQTLLLSNGAGDFSLYLHDRFFNFNICGENKMVSSFEGDIIHDKLKVTKLELPNNIIDAILFLNTNDNLIPGTGSYIEFNTSNLLYDSNKRLLQIGDIDSSDIAYHFFDNAYAQIKDGEMSGILFTELEL